MFRFKQNVLQALGRIEQQQNAILSILRQEKFEMTTQSDALTALKTQVASNNSATNSAVQLLQGLASQLKAATDKLASGATDDTTDLQDLVTQLNSQATALGQAVTQNTPAAGQ